MDILKNLVRVNALLLQGQYEGAEHILDSAIVDVRELTESADNADQLQIRVGEMAAEIERLNAERDKHEDESARWQRLHQSEIRMSAGITQRLIDAKAELKTMQDEREQLLAQEPIYQYQGGTPRHWLDCDEASYSITKDEFRRIVYAQAVPALQVAGNKKQLIICEHCFDDWSDDPKNMGQIKTDDCGESCCHILQDCQHCKGLGYSICSQTPVQQSPVVAVPDQKLSGKLVELITKAILFEDDGSTEQWEENINLGQAALKAIPNDWQLVPKFVTKEMRIGAWASAAEIRPNIKSMLDIMWADLLKHSPIFSGDTSPRITEKDAREIKPDDIYEMICSAASLAGVSENAVHHFWISWFGIHGRTLLNKLNDKPESVGGLM